MSKPYNILDIACFVVNRHNEIYTDKYINNVRLQQILYFIQCYFYFIYGKCCFKEKMYACDFGITSSEVYEEFCIYGGDKIPNIESYYYLDKKNFLLKKILFNSKIINKKDKELIEYVIKKCSNISTYDLINICKSQAPYKNNYIKGEKNKIPNEDIKKFIERNGENTMDEKYKLKEDYADGKITISLEEYYELLRDSQILKILDWNGVDNWSGYDLSEFDEDEFHNEFWEEYCNEFPRK